MKSCRSSPVTPMRGARGPAGPWLRIAGGVVAIAGLFLPAAEAFALWDDKLTLFAEEKATYDDNVFRISKNVSPQFIGASSAGDTYRTTSLGFGFDVPASRQRFQGGYTWNATRYNQYTDLDSDRHDKPATWLWQLGNDASGQLGYTETSALASFAFTQTRTLDRLKTQQAFFNRSEEHTSELQSPCNLVCRLLLEKKKNQSKPKYHHDVQRL